MAQNISKNFSRIGTNIRKIRQAKKISQADFAQLFNLARPSVGAYEEGRSEPKIDTVIQIANYFKISIDVLLTRDLTISEIYSFDQLNKKLDKVHPVKTSENRFGKDAILVRITHYLEYIVNLDKKDYLRRLEVMSVPVTQSGVHRVFEMNGSEMEYEHQGLHHQDLLVCELHNTHDHEDLDNKILVVVHKEGIITRRLKSVDSKELVLKADDPNYPEITIKMSDVLEIWKTTGIFSTYMNPPSRLEERILKVEEALKKMKSEGM